MTEVDKPPYEIAEVYLPPLRDQDVKHAEEARWTIWRCYHISEDDCLAILRAQRTIFKRLLRIDPVLRRPKSGVAPFATRLVYPSKAEVKEARRKIHDCFDHYGLTAKERHTYLYAINLLCLQDMHIVHAEVQLRMDNPSQQ